MSQVHRARKEIVEACRYNAERLPSFDDIQTTVKDDAMAAHASVTEAGFLHLYVNISSLKDIS